MPTDDIEQARRQPPQRSVDDPGVEELPEAQLDEIAGGIGTDPTIEEQGLGQHKDNPT